MRGNGGLTGAFGVSLLLAVFSTAAAAHGETLTVSGLAYTQNFNSLVTAGSGSLSDATFQSGGAMAGWTFHETLLNANTTYTGGSGSSDAGDTYSFGTSSISSDRAFGSLSRDNALATTLGVQFKNNIGRAIVELAVAFTGEQWRLGVSSRGSSNLDRMEFQYSLDATSLTTGTWVDVDALDFKSVTTSGGARSLNGNLSQHRKALSSVIPVHIPNGAEFWLRWVDPDITGSDDGMAIDDFSLTPTAAPVPVPLAGVAGGALLCLVAGRAAWSRRSLC